MQVQDYEAAHNNFTMAISVERNPTYLVNRGDCLREQGKLELCITDYMESIQLGGAQGTVDKVRNCAEEILSAHVRQSLWCRKFAYELQSLSTKWACNFLIATNI